MAYFTTGDHESNTMKGSKQAKWIATWELSVYLAWIFLVKSEKIESL